MEEPANQEIIRNPDGTFPKGVSGNPAGRPAGKTMKEYVAEKFRKMSDEEKEQWLKDHYIEGVDKWKMAEGNPHSTNDVKVELPPIPIDDVRKNNSV